MDLTPASPVRPRWSRRRLAVVAFAVVVLFFVMRRVLNPFGAGEYLAVSHGNHSHYVPHNRDPEASISNFPTSLPGPGQCITRTGPLGVRRGDQCAAQ